MSTRFSLSMEMNRLTRDGTAEPVSQQDQILGVNRDREKFIFPVQLTTSRIGSLTRLILSLAILVYAMTIQPADSLGSERHRYAIA